MRPGVPLYATAVTEQLERGSGLRLSELSDTDRTIATNLVVALKTTGYGYREIRKMTGLGSTVIMRILREARERHGLADVLADLDMDLVPKAVDNARRFLEKPWTEQGTRATFDVLEGRGVLVKHQKTASVAQASMEFKVTYTNAPAQLPPPTGQIEACPRED